MLLIHAEELLSRCPYQMIFTASDRMAAYCNLSYIEDVILAA